MSETPTDPSPEDILRMRKAAALTQTEAAYLVGLTLRAYQQIEGAGGNPRSIHVRSFERGLLDLAVERGDVSLVPPSLMGAVLRDAGLAGAIPEARGTDPALVALEARLSSLKADIEPVEAALAAYHATASRT